MRYTKDYLEKYHTPDINEQVLSPFSSPLAAALGGLSDVAKYTIGRALATARDAGTTKRASMIKRLSTAGFGGVPSGSDPNYAAIINQLQIDTPGLVGRLGQRVGAQFQQLRFKSR
tara:strand:+ start:943 stop:1290 length:348 start_codon:yes stop_codon:yes gene_type:complete